MSTIEALNDELIRLHRLIELCIGKANMDAEINWALKRIEFLQKKLAEG